MTKDGIYSYGSNKEVSQAEADRNYSQAAYDLYSKLLMPVKDKLRENVIIIPDGVLGYIPFEALITEVPPRIGAYQAYQYVIEDHQVSYCYSATLLEEMKSKSHQSTTTKRLLSFAPFYQENENTFIYNNNSSSRYTASDTLSYLQSSGLELSLIHI